MMGPKWLIPNHNNVYNEKRHFYSAQMYYLKRMISLHIDFIY